MYGGMLGYSSGIAGMMGLMGVMTLIVGIIGCILSVAMVAAIYLLYCFPQMAIANKVGIKDNWMSYVPVARAIQKTKIADLPLWNFLFLGTFVPSLVTIIVLFIVGMVASINIAGVIFGTIMVLAIAAYLVFCFIVNYRYNHRLCKIFGFNVILAFAMLLIPVYSNIFTFLVVYSDKFEADKSVLEKKSQNSRASGYGMGNQYGGNQYGGNQYGGNQYGGNQYGGNQYGGNQYGGNQYGGNQYGGNQYGGNEYGNTQYGGNEYSNTQYGGNEYGNTQYGGKQYSESEYDQDKTYAGNMGIENDYDADATSSIETYMNSQKKAAPAVKAGLVGVNGVYEGHKFDIEPGQTITIGRDSANCQILYPTEYNKISRQHCTITYDTVMNRYVIIDKSSNGTYVDGVKLEKNIPHNANAESILSIGGENNKFKLI